MGFPLLALAGGLAKKFAPKLLRGAAKVGGGIVRKLGGSRVARVGGAAVATGAAFEVGGRVVRGRQPAQYDQFGRRINPRTGLPFRKRGRGLSGADIRGAQRVMRLVSTFGYKPKLKRRAKRRY